MALVERDQQLEVLRETITASCTTKHGRLVLIAGEPGAGKTALVRAAIGALPIGTRNLLGGCDRLHTARPLSPVLDWADQADPALAAMVRRGSSLHESLDAVISLVSAGPTVAVLEDAHWADDATIDLVIVLARRLERMSTTLIVTYRPEEAGPGSSLALALGDLATTGPLRISVPALTASGVDTLAAGRSVDVAELLERTGGNAFFVTECLSTDEAIPRSVSDAVLSRVHQLDPLDRDALSSLSVCPNRCELWLARALDVEAAALDRCVAAGVLEAGES